MLKERLIGEMKSIAKFFKTSGYCLSEEDSQYAPQEGLYTVAQQVAHVAQTIDWFFDGAFSPAGFNMEFDKLQEEISQVTSLGAARDMFKNAIANAIKVIENASEEELQQKLPPGPIMGELPRYVIVGAISDHTAHHRGALTVYSRLLGKEPPMPYGEM